jgi:hypothetical protein
MKHIKTLTQSRIPALAGTPVEPPTLQVCLRYLLRTADLGGFKACLDEKKATSG